MAFITDSDAVSVAEGVTLAQGEASRYGATLDDTGQLTPQGPETGTLTERPAIALDPTDAVTLSEVGEHRPSQVGPGSDSASLAEGVTIIYSDPTPDGFSVSELGVVSGIFPEDTFTLDDRETLLTVDDFVADVTLTDTALATVSHAQTDTGTLDDAATVVVSGNFSTSDSEGVTLSESAAVAALLVALDSAAFAEQQAVAIDGTEVLTFADPAAVLATLAITETGTLTDDGSVTQTGGPILVSLSASDAFTLSGESALIAGVFTGRPRGTVIIVARLIGTATASPRTVGTGSVAPRAASTIATEE